MTTVSFISGLDSDYGERTAVTQKPQNKTIEHTHSQVKNKQKKRRYEVLAKAVTCRLDMQRTKYLLPSIPPQINVRHTTSDRYRRDKNVAAKVEGWWHFTPLVEPCRIGIYIYPLLAVPSFLLLLLPRIRAPAAARIEARKPKRPFAVRVCAV